MKTNPRSCPDSFASCRVLMFVAVLTCQLAAFSQTQIPGNATSAGMVYLVPDVACWFNTTGNFVTNGFIKIAEAASPADLGNWDPYTSVVGESTFLVEFNTYANNGLGSQNFVVAKQPAAGGPVAIGYAFYDDSGSPFKAQINLSRQNGSPGRVAGDKRIGATHFVTECEVSIGQLAPFRTVNRWANNNIYSGIARYAAEQIFTLDPVTLAQTPVAKAWDYIYGSYVGVMGPGNGEWQCSRTGGRPEFLDNGNIVVMIDDRTAIASTSPVVTTFAIIQPNGAVVKGPTLVESHDIWDNMCAFAGGFCIRVYNNIYFYDNSGNLTHSNNLTGANANLQAASPSGWGFAAGAAYVIDRGDTTRIASDIRSPYVFLAGAVGIGGSSNACMMAIWNGQSGQFITNVMVSSDLDPAFLTVNRAALAVNMSNQVAVAYHGKTSNTGGYNSQVVARVMQFNGTNVSYLSPSFFAFVNSDSRNTILTNGGPRGYRTESASVSMTTKAICIAAKGSINSTNNPLSFPDSGAGSTTIYTVFSMPNIGFTGIDTGIDIGNPGAPGSFMQSNGVYTVTGSGEDLEGTADAFYFASVPLSGDCQIVARLTALAGPGGAQAGIMIREGLGNASKHVSLLANTGTNVVFRRRLTTDAYSVDTGYAPTNSAWLRLMRMGSSFIGLSSTNSTDWQYVWFTSVNMSNQVQVGLAVTAHHNASYATATIDNVSIGSLSPLPGVWPLSGPKIQLGGESGGYSEFQRVGGFKFLLNGVVDDYATILATTNVASPFASWSTLVTVTNTYGVLPILDSAALTHSLRFYRAQRTGR